MAEDIAALRAQLAEAEARAKAAEAEAARAQAEALKAKLAQAQAAEPEPDAKAEPEERSQSKRADERGFAESVSPSYSFEVPWVTLGTILDGDTPTPPAIARMPIGMFNRHMLVAGATGTGKTRTLQLLAEGLSDAGTAVLLCDVKGDLTGLAEPGVASEKLLARTRANGQDWEPRGFPTEVLKLVGSDDSLPGIPVRVPISDFGPILLSRALDLNTTQEQSLSLVFSWADAQGLELVDLADIRAVLSYLASEDGKKHLAEIGGVSKATAGVILRGLSALEAQGGDAFFGAPGFDTGDLLRVEGGRGVISILQVGDITRRPALGSAVIMWLLADLFAALPEVGDLDKPKLVFFFDEAHLLFSGATKEFLRTVVQTVRLIRSKGVGVVFVTQTPKDIPADVLAQLGSRVQHALRAATPDDQKKLKQTVDTLPTTTLDLAEILTSLGTGEAVVTVLDPDGKPTPVVPARLWAPASVMGPASAAAVRQAVADSALHARYGATVNPESAEEKLAVQVVRAEAERLAAKEEARRAVEAEKAARAAKRQQAAAEKAAERAAQKEAEKQAREAERAERKRQAAIDSALNSALRSMTSGLGREIGRSLFGNRRR